MICFVCGIELTLADSGLLNDFKKHLKRHEVEKNEDHKKKATALLSRWAELEIGPEVQELTDVPHDLIIKANHPGMVCLETLKKRQSDPSHNVLQVHGQSTITAMFSRPRKQ